MEEKRKDHVPLLVLSHATNIDPIIDVWWPYMQLLSTYLYFLLHTFDAFYTCLWNVNIAQVSWAEIVA
jgi:hypothetical protein